MSSDLFVHRVEVNVTDSNEGVNMAMPFESRYALPFDEIVAWMETAFAQERAGAMLTRDFPTTRDIVHAAEPSSDSVSEIANGLLGSSEFMVKLLKLSETQLDVLARKLFRRANDVPLTAGELAIVSYEAGRVAHVIGVSNANSFKEPKSIIYRGYTITLDPPLCVSPGVHTFSLPDTTGECGAFVFEPYRVIGVWSGTVCVDGLCYGEIRECGTARIRLDDVFVDGARRTPVLSTV